MVAESLSELGGVARLLVEILGRWATGAVRESAPPETGRWRSGEFALDPRRGRLAHRVAGSTSVSFCPEQRLAAGGGFWPRRYDRVCAGVSGLRQLGDLRGLSCGLHPSGGNGAASSRRAP